MTGARFVHDTLEASAGRCWSPDAQKVKGLALRPCKTDKIDARVLAELSWRDLVPAISAARPSIRRERGLARYRLHLVRHSHDAEDRIHATLMTFGIPARSQTSSVAPAACCSIILPLDPRPIRGVAMSTSAWS